MHEGKGGRGGGGVLRMILRRTRSAESMCTPSNRSTETRDQNERASETMVGCDREACLSGIASDVDAGAQRIRDPSPAGAHHALRICCKCQGTHHLRRCKHEHDSLQR